MAESPKVSVLIPCYRQERFIREAVESVLTQDFPGWEMVASDDASPDNTAAILEQYARRDPRIRFFCQKKNLGMVENWNFCLRQARGEAVKLMGGDDRLETPDCLTRQWQSLRQPGVALAACGRHLIDEHSRIFQTLVNLPTGVFSAETIIPRMLVHRDNLVGEPVSCLFPVAKAARGFSVQYLQNADIEMWLYLLEKGSLAFDAEPLVAWRVTSSQNSAATWPEDQGWEHLQLILTKAGSSTVPRRTKLKVLFRSEEWISLHPKHRGVPAIRASAAELGKHFSPSQIFLGRGRHRLGKTLNRWGRSLRKRLPL